MRTSRLRLRFDTQVAYPPLLRDVSTPSEKSHVAASDCLANAPRGHSATGSHLLCVLSNSATLETESASNLDTPGLQFSDARNVSLLSVSIAAFCRDVNKSPKVFT